MNNINLAIVVSEFNRDVTEKMLDVAQEYLKKMTFVKMKFIFWVPGTFDMPLAINELVRREDVDVIVTLGAVIKGETAHDLIVAENAARIIADLTIKYDKPISLGITGPDMTFEQAMDRVKIVPIRAIDAVIKMVHRIKKLKKIRADGYENPDDSEVVIIN